MRNAFANADGDGDSADSYAYSNGDSYTHGNNYGKPYANPQLLAGLHNGDYHWHDNPGRYRYRQPLR